jgi:hypothetical protein
VYVVRADKIVWRSRRAFPSPSDVAASSEAVAFSIPRRGLWIARFDGVEHQVGRAGEVPIAWTGAKRLLTLRWGRRSGTLFARPERGGLRDRLADKVRAWAIDSQSGALFFITVGGRLERTDGVGAGVVVAALDTLGLAGPVSLQAAGDGLIALEGSDRIVVLRGDGSLYASSLFPTLKRTSFGLNWFGPVAAGDGGVASVIDEPDGEASDAVDNLFVLHEGATSATRLFSAWNQGDVCGHWLSLSWKGSWLLYSTTEARLVLFDLADAARSLDLSGFVRRLPGMSAGENGYVDRFDVSWAS